MEIFLVIALLMVLGLYRNDRVLKERMRVLGIIQEQYLVSQSIGAFNHDVFKRHSYNEMMLKFWKPVKSFYKGIK